MSSESDAEEADLWGLWQRSHEVSLPASTAKELGLIDPEDTRSSVLIHEEELARAVARFVTVRGRWLRREVQAEDHEEILAQVVTSLYLQLRKGSEVTSLAAYVRIVLRNAHRTMWRSRGRGRITPTADEALLRVADSQIRDVGLVCEQDRSVERLAVAAALERLTLLQARSVLLVDYYGLTAVEAAKTLSKSEGAVRDALRRGRTKIREALDDVE